MKDESTVGYLKELIKQTEDGAHVYEGMMHQTTILRTLYWILAKAEQDGKCVEIGRATEKNNEYLRGEIKRLEKHIQRLNDEIALLNRQL